MLFLVFRWEDEETVAEHRTTQVRSWTLIENNHPKVEKRHNADLNGHEFKDPSATEIQGN